MRSFARACCELLIAGFSASLAVGFPGFLAEVVETQNFDQPQQVVGAAVQRRSGEEHHVVGPVHHHALTPGGGFVEVVVRLIDHTRMCARRIFFEGRLPALGIGTAEACRANRVGNRAFERG